MVYSKYPFQRKLFLLVQDCEAFRDLVFFSWIQNQFLSVLSKQSQISNSTQNINLSQIKTISHISFATRVFLTFILYTFNIHFLEFLISIYGINLEDNLCNCKVFQINCIICFLLSLIHFLFNM